jgi:Fur family transcriptional regulator, ferric uptake regulator
MPVRASYETRQRREISGYFREHPEKCATAEEVYAALGEAVGMATVYRAFARLCREGNLRRYAARDAGEAARYQWSDRDDNLLHIRCDVCGTLRHVGNEAAGEFAARLKSRYGFVLDAGQTMLYGRCERCEASRVKQTQP